MLCSFGTEVAFARNWRCSKRFHSMKSGFCICNTYHRSIFRSRVSRFELHCRPTSKLQIKFTAGPRLV